MDYLKLLNDSYRLTKEMVYDMSKLEYLSDAIFGFTTYENQLSSIMAEKALEVCEAITDKKTFEYMAAKGNVWYLIMVNMPFFVGKSDWGTSTRGAFWRLYNDDEFTLDICSLFDGDGQMLELKLNKEQWPEFIKAMRLFLDQS